MKLNAGLVFLADSRTNAGVDHISTYRKLTAFEQPGERVMVLCSAGNLAISQAVKNELANAPEAESIWRASNLAVAAKMVGDAIKRVHARDAEALAKFNVEFNISLIFGGQIKGEEPRLFHIYAAGNYIEAQDETCYFQIGEAKYGKPIIDRVVTPETPLDEAAKCALISMDSTLRSNLSVGMPLDLLCYAKDSLVLGKFAHIDSDNEYYQMIHNTWGKRLRQVFNEIPDPTWQSTGNHALPINNKGPLRVQPPGTINKSSGQVQVLMQDGLQDQQA
jgi:putative proteasome-type protease